MSIGVTLCFYLVIGAAVAVALWISDTSDTRYARLFQSATGLLFWPLYLPLLLASGRSIPRGEEFLAVHKHPQSLPGDEMAAAIAQVESELDAALRSPNGWSPATLFPDTNRFVELRSAWRQQAERVRELDRLLTATANEMEASAPETTASRASEQDVTSSSADLILASIRVRQHNLSELRLVRQQWHGNLMGTLAWVRQLVLTIHLARYKGEPASRVAELVQQIDDAVEGLSRGT